ncbi:MAG: hypothetical protein NTZ01_05985, partial [Verrucomicrobia bacterium]|nr:hypothetical protein [Verrucomicrobiota bacterium]
MTFSFIRSLIAASEIRWGFTSRSTNFDGRMRMATYAPGFSMRRIVVPEESQRSADSRVFPKSPNICFFGLPRREESFSRTQS